MTDPTTQSHIPMSNEDTEALIPRLEKAVTVRFGAVSHSDVREALALIREQQAQIDEWTQDRREDQIALLRRINAAAEEDMLQGRPITGAHHRAIEAELDALEGEEPSR